MTDNKHIPTNNISLHDLVHDMVHSRHFHGSLKSNLCVSTSVSDNNRNQQQQGSTSTQNILNIINSALAIYGDDEVEEDESCHQLPNPSRQ